MDGIREMEPVIRKVYGLYRAERKFENIIIPALGHVYTPEMWKKTQSWFDGELK